jgi:hypothetical protein
MDSLDFAVQVHQLSHRINLDQGLLHSRVNLIFLKVLVALAVAVSPVLPPQTFAVLFGPHKLIAQSLAVLIIVLACLLDVVLGLLFVALVITVSIQRYYSQRRG